jgi:hypothetical protein
MDAYVINPRHRRRNRRRRATSHRRRRRGRRRARINPGIAAALNPRYNRRRRRHRINARHHRRRRHTNPRFGLPGLGGITSGLKTGVGIGIGVVATEVGTSALFKFWPGAPAALQTGFGRLAAKAVVGTTVLPFLVGKLLRQQGLARNIAVGAWVAISVDLINTYVTPHLGLSDYEQGTLMDYQDGQLLGLSGDEARGGSELAGSVYEGGPYE